MYSIREYVSKLPEHEQWQCIDNYSQFERDGFIGDVPLRSLTEKFLESTKAPWHSKTPEFHNVDMVTLMQGMEKLIFEIFRFQALKHGTESDSGPRLFSPMC